MLDGIIHLASSISLGKRGYWGKKTQNKPKTNKQTKSLWKFYTCPAGFRTSITTHTHTEVTQTETLSLSVLICITYCMSLGPIFHIS